MYVSGFKGALAIGLAIAIFFLAWTMSATASRNAMRDALGMPPPGIGAHYEPLGKPAKAPAGRGGFKFESYQENGPFPVAWDPCRLIHYVISGNGPKGGEDAIHAAVEEISKATGLQFQYDGKTSEPAGGEREAYQSERYPDQWAPLLFAWTTPEEKPELEGSVIGLGGAVELKTEGNPAVYVSGAVYLDEPQIRQQIKEGERKVVASVILHEMGHVVGLAHVDDPGQLMFAQTTPGIYGFQDGDRRGLTQLGQGQCVPGI